MYIKRVVIEGFKSYGKRVDLNDWDKNFCAITGENGSGKSNILDAICFVLGISQLSQVRASSMRQLVYKEGQAKVTKASVTIYFDNRETKESPLGYEAFEEIAVTRQVVIGGRNKYLINGHTAQQSRVQNLFHSVQLNVNNPHFLIMQGRITKVLNMKPPEILGMIEEAAGTRMYETKKVAALSTIAKKDVKVAEINERLTEEITPQIQKLRLECSQFQKWSTSQGEIRRLQRITIAASFHEAEQSLKQSKDSLSGQQHQVDELHSDSEALQRRIEESEQAIASMIKERQAHVSEKFAALNDQVLEQSRLLVKSTSVLENHTNALNDEKSELQKHEVALKRCVEALETHREALLKSREAKETLDAALEEKTSELASLESQQIGIDVGGGGGGGDGSKQRQGTLPQQLMETERLQSEALAAAEQAITRAHHLNAQIAAKRKLMEANEAAFRKQEKSGNALRAKAARVDEQLQQQPSAQQLSEELAELSDEIAAAQSTVDKKNSAFLSLQAECSRFNFAFESPTRDFDRTSVKGRLANLFQLQDRDHALALEVLAGGKLYNVVVDAQRTGKALLQKGRLRNRVTIIPLDKIQAQEMPRDVAARARQLVGDDNVWPALSLVCFDDEVAAAMKFVFGPSFVCRDSNSAKRVTFDKRVRRRCVTLEGDVFDPQGTLSGGARASGKPALLRLKELQQAQLQLQQAQEQLQALQTRHQRLQDDTRRRQQLQEQLELAQHESALLETRLQQSTYQEAADAVEHMSNELAEAEQNERSARERRERLEQKSVLLKKAMQDLEGARSGKMEEVAQQIARLKSEIASGKSDIDRAKQALDRFELEQEELEQELEAARQQVRSSNEQIESVQQNIAQARKEVVKTSGVYDELQVQLADEKELLSERDDELKRLRDKKERFQSQNDELIIELRRLEHQLSRAEKAREGAKGKVVRLMQEHDWIAKEKHLFGKPSSNYDFAAMDIGAEQQRLARKQKEMAQLSKKINKKALGMMEKAEKQYEELMKKRAIIENDRSKIQAVIAELDDKKNEALKKTWVKVNRDFGSVFAALLPGTQAKLEPPEGGSVLDGLEVKVAFGDVWKESLTELSGGQRSLLALALILSLLLFKPAPMYILDEVDAALDLSHTQNIGHMLKTHFSKSQFIVVSLKEGMFSNANVIFRTKFVDGVSTVKRTCAT